MGSSHSRFNGPVSAAERAPTELWQLILLRAVESPLLPRTGDDVVDGLLLFSSGCQSRHYYRKTEIVKTRLRLVCRSWNIFLHGVAAHTSFFFGHTLVRAPIHGGETLKTRRIETADNCILNQCTCLERRSRPHDLETDTEDIATQVQWVEYFQLPVLYSRDLRYQLVMEILDFATRLRALALGPTFLFDGELAHILGHPSVQHVTHLSVGPFGTYSDEHGTQPLSFPAVELLLIRIGDYQTTDGVNSWTFPSLTSLIINRGTHHRDRGLLHGLDRFLAAHGKQVTSLYIECKCRREPMNETFWDWFPNVRLFGTELSSVYDKPRISNRVTSLAIRKIPPYSSADWTRAGRYIDPLIKTCREWGIKQLIILTSWDELTSNAVSPRELFKEDLERGIRVCDVERVPMTAPESDGR